MNKLLKDWSSLGHASMADKHGDFETAIEQYEISLKNRLTTQIPFDRLIQVYKALKRWEDVVRVAKAAIDVFTEENERRHACALKTNPELKPELDTALETNTKVWQYSHVHGQDMVLFNPYPIFKYINKIEKTEISNR